MEKPDATLYLNEIVTIFLTNGVKLNGIITKINPESLILTRDEIGQSVFYHAVACIYPGTVASTRFNG